MSPETGGSRPHPPRRRGAQGKYRPIVRRRPGRHRGPADFVAGCGSGAQVRRRRLGDSGQVHSIRVGTRTGKCQDHLGRALLDRHEVDVDTPRTPLGRERNDHLHPGLMVRHRGYRQGPGRGRADRDPATGALCDARRYAGIEAQPARRRIGPRDGRRVGHRIGHGRVDLHVLDDRVAVLVLVGLSGRLGRVRVDVGCRRPDACGELPHLGVGVPAEVSATGIGALGSLRSEAGRIGGRRKCLGPGQRRLGRRRVSGERRPCARGCGRLLRARRGSSRPPRSRRTRRSR